MKKIQISILIFFSLIFSQNTQMKILNMSLDSISAEKVSIKNVYYDTLKIDSTFMCRNDTCIWEYKTMVDSIQKDSLIHLKIKGVLSFDFYDSKNSESQITLTIGYMGIRSIKFYAVDSVWGSLIIKPGYGKSIFFETILPMHDFNFIEMTAKKLDNSDSIKSSIKYEYYTSSVIKTKINHKFDKNVSYRGQPDFVYSLNGRLLYKKNITTQIIPGSFIKNKRIEFKY